MADGRFFLRLRDLKGRQRPWWDGKTKPCKWCGDEFALTSSAKATAVYCGWPCLMASAQTRMAKFRNPNKSEVVRARMRRGSAKRARTSWKPVAGRWRVICERDGWRCWLCGEAIDASILPPHRWSGSMDHVIPLSQGGSDDDDNLKAAHLRCNARRGAGRFPIAASGAGVGGSQKLGASTC